jgi:hypothetical protein
MGFDAILLHQGVSYNDVFCFFMTLEPEHKYERLPGNSLGQKSFDLAY